MLQLFFLSLQTGSNYHDLDAEQEGEFTAVKEGGGVNHVEEDSGIDSSPSYPYCL